MKKNTFLKSLSMFQLEVLHKYEIIDEEIYSNIIVKQTISLKFISLEQMQTVSTRKSSESSNNEEKIVKDIIEGDKIEELQKLIREKGIKAISPITKSFSEKIKIPIIIECIIKKATKCFKFLLINGIEDPTITIQEQNPYPINDCFYKYWEREHQYKWDCMAVAIYYGEVEIATILEERGIEKGNNPGHIEASLLSYRNAIAKEIINKMKEKKENEENILKRGLNASVKNNNINGFEMLISKGATINAKDIIYQIIIIFF